MPTVTKPGHGALRKGRFSQANRIYLVNSTNLCWVVMPDHIHLLLQLGEADLGQVVKKLKAQSARRLNHEIGRAGRFWAPGFHDHALRKEEDLKYVARYIVANPLRAGLVKRVASYPYWNAVWL